MELKEMIKVMQHFENGGKVEVKPKNTSDNHWATVPSPSWDWAYSDYRIKEEKQKVTIEKWLIKDVDTNEYFVKEGDAKHLRYDNKIKLLWSYEIELKENK